MEKQRQMKFLAILALVLAVTALTLGYAAFSTTLNISSNASVNPSGKDFVINIYGFKDEQSWYDYNSIFEMEDYFLDDKKTPGINSLGSATCTDATIDNTAKTISGISVNYINNQAYVTYPIIIRNEGKYTAYINTSQFSNANKQGEDTFGYLGTCTAENGTSQSLVDKACSNVYQELYFLDNQGQIMIDNSGHYKIEPGDYINLILDVHYSDAEILSDGPFSVSFPDIKLNFSTTK